MSAKEFGRMVRGVFVAMAFMAMPLAALSQPAPPAAAAPVAAAKPERTSLEGIAAIVNDKPISYSDVRQRARMMLLSFGGRQPTQEQIQQITGQALEQLIDEHLQMEKAREFELEVDKRDVDEAVEEMARPTGSTGAELRKQLQAAGINPTSLEDQMRAEIAWQRIMGGLYGSRIRISEYQLNEQLNRLRASLKKTQYRISEIFMFAPDAETKAEALKAASSIASQLRQGADFRIAAQRLSSSPTAATGGDMGWVSSEDLLPELAAAISKTAGPGLLDPVPVENGVYLIQVANKREPSALTTKLNLKRLTATDGSEATLKAALSKIKSCDDVASVANTTGNLRATDLNDISIDELGEEGKSMVQATEVGKATDIFAAGSGLAVMYVCSRNEGAEALPSKEELKGSLRSRELNMISERELRDLRREATIIYP
jgi:peptidyl-prolyl cis-trans isomerase SurA